MMRPIALANVAGVSLALVLSLAFAFAADLGSQRTRGLPASHAEDQVIERDGQRGLVDATGHFHVLRHFERIVSVSGVADDLLLALCEPERIVAFSAYAKRSAGGHRFGDRVLQRADLDPETLLALAPDLVLVNNLSRQDRIVRLRESGVAVFDLGDMRGMKTLVPNIRTAGILLGHPRAGRELAQALTGHMQALAARVPSERRKRALYAGIHGDKIYGGTRGTSYADVLWAAGLEDAAADRYHDWPRYTSEQLLSIDPPMIVTQAGMADTFCRHPGMASLRACRAKDLIEIDPALLLDPGLEMPLAADAIQRKAYRDLKPPVLAH